MTDILDQEGINFMSSGMASTAPTVKPDAITAPKINMEAAPANQTIPAVSVSELQAPLPKGGSVPPPPDPQQIADQTLAGGGSSEALAAAGAAPPQPPATSDILDKEGIAVNGTLAPAPNAFSKGIQLPVQGQSADPEQVQAESYATAQQQETQRLAGMRFTPEQIKSFVNSPTTMSEAIQNQQEWPDIPVLLDKYQKGEPLDQNQNNRVSEYVDTVLKSSLRGTSWDGSKAITGQQLPATAIDFIQSGNNSKGQINGDTAPASTSAIHAILPSPYTPRAGETPLNEFAAVTDKGKQLMASAADKPATTALLTAAHISGDVAAAPGKNGTPLISSVNDLPAPIRAALYEVYKQQNPSATVSQAFSPTGFQKMIAAIGEDKAAEIIHWYSPMSFEEHQNAKWAGEMFPVSEDERGRTRLDFRAGMTAPLAEPGDVMEGKVNPEEAGRDIAMNLAMIEFGEGAGRTLAGKGKSNVTPEGTKPTVDDYLKAVVPSKDQTMVNSGVVSIDGAESNAHTATVNLLKDKGVSNAQDIADSMTAMEKENYANHSIPVPQSDLPTLKEYTPEQSAARQVAINPMATPEAAMHADTLLADGNDDNVANNQSAAQAAKNPPPIQADQSGFNARWQQFKTETAPKIYAETLNDIQPIQDLSKKAKAAGAVIPEGQDFDKTVQWTKTTVKWIERNQTQDTTTWDTNGNQVITGKGLKPIYDDFDNMFLKTEKSRDVRHGDFDDYLKAKTFLEDKANGGTNVTPENEAKAVADLQRLGQKYGDNFRFFDTFAGELRDWDNRILHNLVTSGIKTQEWYDATTEKRSHYSPLNRVFEESEAQDVETAMSGKAIAKNPSPSTIGSLKERVASNREIKDTFQSRLKNSAVILQKSAVNKLRKDIAEFANYYPDDIKISKPAVLREAVEHSYDPKLRAKLEQLVDFLGGEVKRADKVKGEGKGTLGAYSPGTKTVYLARGTTEGTLTHEAGHMLDYVLGLKDRLLKSNEHPEIRAELEKLAEGRLNAEISLQKNERGMTSFAEEAERAPKKYMKYLKNDDEVLANFFDTWVNSPERLAKEAPHAKAEFERLIADNPQLNMLNDIRPSTARAVETIEKPMLDMRGPKDSLPVYINGRRMYMEMSPEIAKAFKSLGPMEMGYVARLLDGVLVANKKMLQFGATSSPDFMIRHFYRAIQTSFLNSPGKKGILAFAQHAAVDIPKAVFAVIGKTELYHEWASSSGALSTYMDLSDKGLAKMQKQMFESGKMADFLNPIHWYKVAREVSDYAPRIAVYEKMKAEGMSDLGAGIMSLEATGNYIRHGSAAARVNRWSPFFNDMAQGGDRFIRSFAKNPAAYSIRAFATVMLPQILFTGYYLFAADQKTRDEYLNLNSFRKAASMNVKIGDTWVPIPRAFAPGHLFGALPEQIMIWMYTQNHADAPRLKDFWLRSLADMVSSVSPVVDWTRALPPAFKAAIENITNYSLFMQKPLFMGDINKTAPEDQINPNTSETAKILGHMFNYSPVDIDNMVYDMAAKSGRFAMQLSDMAINAEHRMTGQPVNEKAERVTDNPLYGGLLEQTPRGTATLGFEEFQQNLHEAQQAHNHMQKNAGKDTSDYEEAHADTLGAYQGINAANTQVGHLLKQIRNINQDTNLSGHDKTAQVNDLQDQITSIVTDANRSYRDATQGGKQ